MNCDKAQYCIEQYLNETISDRDFVDFVDHIRNCPACREDLEIYYIMDLAQKYLDEDLDDTYDIEQRLKKDMGNKIRRMRNRNRLIALGVTVVLIIIAALLYGLCMLI